MSTSTRSFISPATLAQIETLADLLRKRRALNQSGGTRTADRELVVIPFVGAGASAAAGFPDGGQLKQAIWKEVLGDSGPGADRVEALFDLEARDTGDLEPETPLTALSLFKFAAVVSRTKYGRDAIHSCLERLLPPSAGRPLCYELLAHLAKHDFVDDFVSLNFDSLLDESLRDELPERLQVIDAAGEIPGALARRRDGTRYLIKPFGSTELDHFKLRLDEIETYGSASIWRFMLAHAFGQPAENVYPHIVLILIGYAAEEPAFTRLIRELGHPAHARVTIFCIDIKQSLGAALQHIRTQLLAEVHLISLNADDALSVLLQMLKLKHQHEHVRTPSPDYEPWTPTARHEIVAACFGGNPDIAEHRRFRCEVILQAVKSRGFFTLDGAADVGRIRRYGRHASQELMRLVDANVIRPHKGGGMSRGHPKRLRGDYELVTQDYLELANAFLRVLDVESRPFGACVLTGTTSHWSAEWTETDLAQFVAARFEAIAKAPAIEVSNEAMPATHWMFTKPDAITTVAQLTRVTSELLREGLKHDEVDVTGVWETGEWLFHPNGWAYEHFGSRLISMARQKKAVLRMVTATYSDHLSTTRGRVAREVRRKLGDALREHRVVDWWQHNRCLTLIKWRDGGDESWNSAGIYFRRRHGSPLVAPVAVGQPEDCEVLEELYQYYYAVKGSSPGDDSSAGQSERGLVGDARGEEGLLSER